MISDHDYRFAPDAAPAATGPRFTTLIDPTDTSATPDMRTWGTIDEARAYLLGHMDAGFDGALVIGNGDGTDVVEVVRS